MGWFWADGIPRAPRASNVPDIPAECPMHRPTISPPIDSTTSCPFPQGAAAETPSTTQRSSPSSTLAALNPLNYMPSDLSQSREFSDQTIELPRERQTSSIPRGSTDPGGSGNWVYPSPQQMYNAMLRKGYKDAPEDAVEAMVSVHNFLNEGAWAEIVEWERRFSKGLAQGWQQSARGEEGSWTGAMILPNTTEDEQEQPRLLRFQGRSKDMTPKATMLQVLGWMYPSKYASPPPFDRHDWYVERSRANGSALEVRYVIDYYSGPPETTGEPVFYLDIRPALDRPSAAAERLVRWGRDTWWRASGGNARIAKES